MRRASWKFWGAATFAVATLLAMPAQAQEETAPPEASVAAMAVGTGVVERAVVGESEVFSAGTESLVCWTDLRDAKGQTVVHAWIHEGVTRARVEITPRAVRWRCWSQKKLLPEWKGAWEVKVLTADGRVLSSASFTVE